ncbi:hypothetical protein [Dictyobacter arantiisoli]|uniref:Uncharacterized protein n=1 Tax=Dictyobacter arantiisoli TaxID=2014874 RepID=A0A5A5T9K6_9CHLR|nr:hypothetical protein [Dictyobacter arantiisoli]GCF07713.1 hypothetical protein KDI_12770 [Dictyobacter arantiisoli]
MFEPLRFNKLLKAIPGLDHLQLTPRAAHHAKSPIYAHIREEVDVEKVKRTAHGAQETHIHEDIKKDIKVTPARGQHATEVQKNVSKDIKIKQVQQVNGKTIHTSETLTHVQTQTSETLAHVHATSFAVASIEMTPPHPPREDTPIYLQTHRHLVYKLDTPCAICGVRQSTLHDSTENPFGAQDIETHHYPIERSLLNACDPKKIHLMFPQVKDHQTLEDFIDSEANIMVLCDIHHRHPHYGIHHLLAQDFFIQPYLFGGYQVVADAADAAKVLATNERVIHTHSAHN